jgi:hypothetical protein
MTSTTFIQQSRLPQQITNCFESAAVKLMQPGKDKSIAEIAANQP